ncbi:MAG: amino acid adenylation domain-containing protein [Acidobacteriota bacterium]
MTVQTVEDIYPLSPMQKGMLFHSLYQEQEGAYWQQLCGSLSGVLDVDSLARAWRTVIDRHAVLRTAFEWEDLDEPLQIVCRQVNLPLAQMDWRALSTAEQESRLEDLLLSERRRGHRSLQVPPLMRLVLVRTGEQAHHLAWTFHHILLDGWCGSVVIREVFSLYDAYRAGRPLVLDRPVPYRDYIAWLLGREGAGSDEDYWRRTLEGFSAPTPLPSDGPSGVGHAAETLRLEPEAAAAVATMARRAQITQNTLVQGAWALLLSLYSGEEDVVFGSVVSGRPAELAGAEGIIGLFINTVPVRVRVRYAAPLVGFLRDIQRQQYETREHEHCLLADVQSWSEVPAGRSLFESLLVFQNFLVDQDLAETLVQSREIAITRIRSTGQATFPLTLSASPNDGLALRLEYDQTRFQKVGARRLLDRLAAWFKAFVELPERRVADLPWLAAAERHQIVVEWNDTSRSWGASPGIHELVAAQTARSPEATALAWPDGEMSYRELDLRATALARRLRRSGVGPETVVGVLLERSPEMVIALLGILKAGGAYLPLDPAAPPDRQDLIVRNARPVALVTAGPVEIGGECLSVPRVHLRLDEPELKEELGVGPVPEWRRDSLAYVIYTSGSSGEPKGVMISHRAIANRLLWTQARFPLGSGDCLLQKTPFVFDASVWEIFVPLLGGARLFLAEAGGHRDASYLLRAVADRSVTVLQLVPSMLGVLLQEPGVEEKASGLRRMFCGGEALAPALVSRFFERLPGVELCNLYGPTEVAIDATSWICALGQEQIPIGRPLDNVRTWVLGPERRPVPAGAVGVLHVGGVGLARGYLRSAGLTAERFVPDPLSGVAGERLYDTGDRVRQRPDGALEYLGRADQQVKVRGFRIEPGEIESVLSRHPAVQGAVVRVLEAPTAGGGGSRLVAYLAHGPNAAPQAGELRSFLARSLPEHMVPAGFVFLESLPRTAGGKVDRRALPIPSEPAEESAVAPRSPVEEILADIWQEVLGVARPGAHDHFFALGGHSLLATQVISRVRKIFGLEVPLRVLFEGPTLGEFAARVEQGLAGDDRSEAPPIEPVSRAAPLPLSFAQQRLWFLHQLEPESPAYNIALSLRLLGRLAPAVLESSLGELVRRHEGLRTSFPATEGQPVQEIAPASPVRLPCLDLEAVPETMRSDEIRRLARRVADAPFALQTGPLLRFALLRSEPDDHVLLLTLHHAIADGWSLAILVHDVVALYGAFLAGRPSPLADLAIQYADYAHWQRRWLEGEVLEGQLAYWRENLAGAPQVIELPTDRIRPAMQGSRGAALPVALPVDLTRRLKRLGGEEGVTPFMTLLAAFQIVLGRTSGRLEVCVGTPVAGRNRLETEGLVGLLLNALVLRGDLSGNPRFRELLGRVRETTLGAYAHQDVPFELLVEELRPERSLSHSPLYQVMLILQNTPQVASELPGLRIEGMPREHTKSNLDLTLNLAEAEGALVGSIEYSTDLFDAVTVERLLRHFEALLAGIADGSELPVAELPLLVPGEREQLLRGWNRTERDFPSGRPFHELFRDQARRTPGAVAAVCGTSRRTYAELEEVSNRLAGRLAASGARPERLVALLADRGLDFHACMLAIWKAGCVYLPLDPLHPPERLAAILSRGSAEVLLAAEGLRTVAESALDGLPLDGRAVLLTIEDLLALPAENSPAGGIGGVSEMAYILFTSGSTGVPKGVMVEQRGMVNHLFAKIVDLELGPEDAVAQTAAQTFDISIWQFLAASLVGGRVEIFPDEVSHDPSRLADAVEACGVSILETVPSLLHALLVELESREQRRPVFAALRWLIPTGEALAPELCRQWLASYPRTPILNAYGPTECSDDVTHEPIRSAPDEEVVRVPIGLPVANTRIYVLDRFEIVPIGVPGELVVGGVGVGRGYLGEPSSTARSFVPDPFGGESGARLYRTGDLARRLRSGKLDFLGRIDHQVKVRGFRIELGEIETALNRLPQVRESAVSAIGEAVGNRFLVAYFVPAEGAEIAPGDLAAALTARLPVYMVPSVFVALASLPLTTSGKLDRKALARIELPEAAGARDGTPFTAPRTPTEELVGGIWCELLGLVRVGRGDNFFDLGGHSLLATRALSRLRLVLDVDLPLRTFFEAATVAELSERIDELRKESCGIAAPAIGPTSRDRSLPLSFAQQRLWFLDQLEPGSPFYNIPQAVRISGRLDVGHLARAVNEVTRRHEVLRTSFATIGGQPTQVIAPAEPFPLPLVDLGSLPSAVREREASRQVEQEARRPFDLRDGLPVRWSLLRVAAEDHLGLFTLHHVAADEWSMGILLGEIAALVGAFSEGLASPLPELPVQYADYSAWQRGWLAGDVLEALLSYWREQLAGELPILALPTDHPRANARSFRGERTVFTLPLELTRDLHALSRREGTTLFMTLLAAFDVLLFRTTAQEDLVVGTAIAGRDRVETEPLIGFFINMLPLRVRISPTSTFRNLLRQVREISLGAFAHQELPFDKLVEELQPDRQSGEAPIFQVAFGLRNLDMESHEVSGLSLRPVSAATETVRFDLTLWMSEEPAGLRAAWTWRSDLFASATIERMNSRFRTLLESIVAQPDTAVDALEMHSDDEKERRAKEEAIGRAASYEKFKSFKPKGVMRPEVGHE